MMKTTFSIRLVFLGIASPLAMMGTAAMVSGQPFGLSHTFNDPTVTIRDEFGYSVALDGDRVLIGAPGDRTNSPDPNFSGVGQAHLFDTTGNLLQTFDDPTVDPILSQDQFGYSVALDGGRVLIGAPHHGRISRVGQAHLFDTTGNLLQTFDDPTITGGDEFGSSVALNGNYALIGAPYDSTNGTSVGQAHLFDATTGNLVQTFDDPPPNDGHSFGYSVAMEGNHVLVGAPFDNTNGGRVGQAHLFDTTGNLLQTFDIPNVPGFGVTEGFGLSVAIDGSRVLVGMLATVDHEVYLFDTTGNLLQTFADPTPPPHDHHSFFGAPVALDGNIAVVGDPTNAQVHLFDATTGNLLQTFNDIAISGVALSGTDLLVGSSDDDTNGAGVGQAYLYVAAPVVSGDYSGDGFVAQEDLDLVLLNWGTETPPIPEGWTGVPPVGLIEQNELDGVLLNWGEGIPSNEDAVAVPEPGAAWLLLLGLGSLCLRARCTR